jgi:hypothetical protein
MFLFIQRQTAWSSYFSLAQSGPLANHLWYSLDPYVFFKVCSSSIKNPSCFQWLIATCNSQYIFDLLDSLLPQCPLVTPVAVYSNIG